MEFTLALRNVQFWDAAISFAKEMAYYHIEEIKKKFPRCSPILNDHKIIVKSKWEELLLGNNSEFTFDRRGKEWSNNTKEEYSLFARQDGVKHILMRANPGGDLKFEPGFVILDSLAGNGFINRAANVIFDHNYCPVLVVLMYHLIKFHLNSQII